MEDPRRFESGSVGHGRAISFFDAIYGFAITLLVVNIDPPAPEYWGSLPVLLDSGLGTNLFAFTLSFIVIAVFWWSNHRALSGLAAIDPPTVFASIIGIFFVVLIPFATQAIGDPGTSTTALAVSVYAAVIAFAVLAQMAVYAVARSRGLMDPMPSARRVRLEFIDAAITPFVFLVSIPIAFLAGADAGRWTWASLLVLGPISGMLVKRALRNESAPSAPSA